MESLNSTTKAQLMAECAMLFYRTLFTAIQLHWVQGIKLWSLFAAFTHILHTYSSDKSRYFIEMSVMLRVKIFNGSLVLRTYLEAIVVTKIIRFLYTRT